MNLNHLNREDRLKIDIENLAQTKFIPTKLILEGDSLIFYNELIKQYAGIYITRIKIEAQNNSLWGSMGFQRFTNELINNYSFKDAIKELNPFEENYELKNKIELGGTLFDLLGDLCNALYLSESNLKNEDILKVTKAFIDDNLKEIYRGYRYIRIHESWTKWFWNRSTTRILINNYSDEMLMICIRYHDLY